MGKTRINRSWVDEELNKVTRRLAFDLGTSKIKTTTKIAKLLSFDYDTTLRKMKEIEEEYRW